MNPTQEALHRVAALEALFDERPFCEISVHDELEAVGVHLELSNIRDACEWN